jgi:hypothetical protein
VEGVVNITKCEAIAAMRRTDYFSDDEAADAIDWLIAERRSCVRHGIELVAELQNYKDALWKATGDNGKYVKEYLEATK